MIEQVRTLWAECKHCAEPISNVDVDAVAWVHRRAFASAGLPREFDHRASPAEGTITTAPTFEI